MKQRNTIGSSSGIRPSDYVQPARRYGLDEAYQLRDALRKKYIRRAEQGKPFPRRAQHLLDCIERVIASQERAAVLRTGELRALQRLRIST